MGTWHRVVGCFLAGAIAFTSGAGGGSVTTRAVDGIKASSRRPVPQVPPRPSVRPEGVWVPDRWVTLPGDARPVHVPGHWERRLSERESYVPPLVVGRPSDGSARTIPGGFRLPVEERYTAP
jgi:hypothetical protein